jgi:transcriptional regulator with XRE-family HTH domain
MANIEKIYNTVGASIRKAREDQRISQEELSARLQLTRTSVSNFERGRQHIQLHTLYEIAQILDVPISALLPERELVSDQPSQENVRLVEQLLRGDTKEPQT